MATFRTRAWCLSPVAALPQTTGDILHHSHKDKNSVNPTHINASNVHNVRIVIGTRPPTYDTTQQRSRGLSSDKPRRSDIA